MSSPEAPSSRAYVARPRAASLGLALLLAALGAGCDGGGFRPLYGSAEFTAHADEKLARVDVAPVPGRAGQRIRNELIFATTGGGVQAPPLYRLEIAVRESITSTLVQRDGNTLGQIYNVDANFRLIRLDTKQVVMQGTSFGRAGFERFTSIFSNVRASSDAEDRAARTVATDLRSRLAAFLATQA